MFCPICPLLRGKGVSVHLFGCTLHGVVGGIDIVNLGHAANECQPGTVILAKQRNYQLHLHTALSVQRVRTLSPLWLARDWDWVIAAR